MRDNLRRYRALRDALKHGGSGAAQQPRRQTLDDTGGSHERHRREQAHPAAALSRRGSMRDRVKCFPRWCDHEATASALGSERSMTVGELPTDGEILCVRLWYVMDGTWQFSDFQYTAALAL